MTMKEILESAKDQIQHLDKQVQAFDHEGEFHYPLHSTNNTIQLLDDAIREDVEQELKTRLYNLRNTIDAAAIRDNTILPADVMDAMKDADETLKKVIQ